jgi:hypothetical protein
MRAVRMNWISTLLFVSCVAACAPEANVHDTKQAKSQGCIYCHTAAYLTVKTTKHYVGAGDPSNYPITCNDCHGTNAWVPTVGGGGHPEARFPLTGASKHNNAAIKCADCHKASLGENTGGQNTDCIHCHIGAHTIVGGYTPASEAAPNSCLGCHQAGQRL